MPSAAQPSTDADTARTGMSQGASAMKSGNFSAAVAAYSTVTQSLPNFAEGFFNLGLAFERAGRLDDARTALERAVRLKPGLRGVNLFLGIVDYRQNRFKQAEERLNAETRLDPRNAKAFMWIGVCRLAEDDPKGAIAPLEKAYALEPSDPDILYHRGDAYLEVANASYAAMYRLDHDSVRVHQVLAEAYASGFRTQEAIDEFQLAIKIAPKNAGLHEELGDQLWIAGQLDRVAAEYREELANDPYASSAMYKLGSLLVLNQSPSDGVELLHKALQMDPSLVDAHYYLGTGLLSLNRDQDAIAEFNLAIAADPANDRAMTSYYKLAQIYRKLDQPQQAQAAMGNFLRMRNQTKQRQDYHTAQLARKRGELPVDPERNAISANETTP